VAVLEVRNLTKAYGKLRAVDDVSFRLQPGQVLALLGPSGSGKTTLLALLAGLETPDDGDILWDGRSLLAVPTHLRGFGLMFQDYALFPHKNVADNVGFGLKMQGRGRAEIEARVRQVLELTGMAGFEHRDVTTLSGGEQQRVALARALAPNPRLLMLDEPLGALDRALRERLLDELRQILRRLNQTAVYVTHDQEEAFALADKVIILRAGRVAQRGQPAEVYARPASRFVAQFLGLRNVFPAEIERRDGALVAETVVGALPLDGTTALEPGQRADVLVRAEGLRLVEAGAGLISGRIAETSFRGSRRLVEVEVEVGGQRLMLDLPAHQAVPQPGEPVGLHVGEVYVVPNNGEEA
jgi:thiamine transport system ATP-binding protein